MSSSSAILAILLISTPDISVIRLFYTDCINNQLSCFSEIYIRFARHLFLMAIFANNPINWI